MLVGKLTFNYKDLINSTDKDKDLWVSFGGSDKKVVNIAGILRSGLARNAGVSPQLHVHARVIDLNIKNQLRINLVDYRIIVKGEDAYTSYQAVISKNDGTS